MSNRRRTAVKKQNHPVNNQQSRDKQVQVTEHQSFAGPLPPPVILSDYENIHKGLANRIVEMAEREQSVRHQLDIDTLACNKDLADKQFSERNTGQHYGLIIGLSGLVCSGFLGYLGLETASGIVGGTTVIGLVGIFVTGQLVNKKGK